MKIYEIDYKPQKIDMNVDNFRGRELNEYIKKNCKQWLAATSGTHPSSPSMTGNMIYRGVSSKKPYFMQSVRSDRIPKDSSMEVHDAFQGAIRSAGKKANRANSIFVTGNYRYAATHGEIYAVFPMGNFYYTWHPDHHDWTSDWMDGDLEIWGDTPFPVGLKMFENTIKGDDGSLNDAIDSGNEIMIHCRKAVYISYEISRELYGSSPGPLLTI